MLSLTARRSGAVRTSQDCKDGWNQNGRRGALVQNEGLQVLAAEDPGAAVLLDDYRALRDGQLRRSLEAEHGLFIAEGTKIIVRALEAGLRPRSLLLTPRWWEQLRPHLPDGSRLPVVLADEQFTEHLTGFHVHRGALGSFERPTPRTVDQVAGPARRLMVVEDLVDHTKVGALIRNAAARLASKRSS